MPASYVTKRTFAGILKSLARAASGLALGLAVGLGLTVGTTAGSNPARADDGILTIGVSQFASTLHPSIEASVAKSYILDMARRPFTAFDAEWQLICMLCTELPTLENGLAVLEDDAGGRRGHRPDLYDPAGRDLGGRNAGIRRRRGFYLGGRPAPAIAVRQYRALTAPSTPSTWRTKRPSPCTSTR